MTSARFFYRDPEAPAPNRPMRVVVVAFVEHDELRTLDIIPTVRHIVDRYLEDRTALVLA